MSGDLRKRLQVLPHSEFRAFLQQKFPETERQISPEADRTAQINTLFGRQPRDEVEHALNDWLAERRQPLEPAAAPAPTAHPTPASAAPSPKPWLGPMLGGLATLSLFGLGALSTRLLLPTPSQSPAPTRSAPRVIVHVCVGSIEEIDELMKRLGRHPNQLDTPEQAAASLKYSGLDEVHVTVCKEPDSDQRRILALSASPTQKLDAATAQVVTATRYTPQQIPAWQANPVLKPLAQVASQVEQELVRHDPRDASMPDAAMPEPDDKPPPPRAREDMAPMPKGLSDAGLHQYEAIKMKELEVPPSMLPPSVKEMSCYFVFCIGPKGTVDSIRTPYRGWSGYTCSDAVSFELESQLREWRFKQTAAGKCMFAVWSHPPRKLRPSPPDADDAED